MLSKISTPKANAVGRRYNGFENKSTLVSPPSSTKHSEPRGHFFNFPSTTKAMNTSEIVSSMATGNVSKKDKNFKNMSGPIQFDKSHSGWQHNFSGLSHNSSSSKIGVKESRKNKASSSNPKGDKVPEDANREIMKKITSDNKYFAILKKITQDSGRHYSYTNTLNSKQPKTNVREEEKDYEVVDSSGGTQDNLIDVSTNKSNYRMYGTEKIDMKKYNNLISQGPIMIDCEQEGEYDEESIIEPKTEFPIQPGKALKLYMDKLTDYEKSEILDYKNIYFLGLDAQKFEGSPIHEFNYGYDDERGDYIVNIGDHIAYRFEIVDFLGKGSFGQALK